MIVMKTDDVSTPFLAVFERTLMVYIFTIFCRCGMYLSKIMSVGAFLHSAI